MRIATDWKTDRALFVVVIRMTELSFTHSALLNLISVGAVVGIVVAVVAAGMTLIWGDQAG